jgi:uncharacterized protein (TIGR02594 family)
MVDQPPSWLIAARKEIGKREIPENRGPVVQHYIDLAHCGSQGDAWCAIFANAMLEQDGIKGTRSPSSQSFRHSPDFVQLAGPALGAITVYWRISKSSGLGHVGFYEGEDSHGYINTLGGNESDMVREELLNPRGSTFGLVGYYWPKSVTLPAIGKLPVQMASAVGSGKVT